VARTSPEIQPLQHRDRSASRRRSRCRRSISSAAGSRQDLSAPVRSKEFTSMSCRFPPATASVL